MTVTARVLIPAKLAENAQTTQYTSTNAKTIIDKFTATNETAGAVTLSVNLVTFGDTAGSQNLVLKTKSIGAGETYLLPEIVGQILGMGDFISTLAGSASAITIRASGREIT